MGPAIGRPRAGARSRDPEGQIIGDYGRIFDLIVIGKATEQALIDWQVMCEAAFFESGRLALVAGGRVPETLGKRAMIQLERQHRGGTNHRAVDAVAC